ncbi:MAG: CPBP family intramembrane metalloprotease [Ruminococcaceae bacterium]|nr:CPBP family intramembrane metalloprotease [Oscillospiraceae bacterium]
MNRTRILMHYCRNCAAVCMLALGGMLCPLNTVGTVIKYALYVAATLVAGYNFKTLRNPPPPKLTLLGVAVMLTLSVLISFLPLEQRINYDTSSTLFYVTVLLLAPLFEELFFRGGLIKFELLPATTLMSALFFGAFHGLSGFLQAFILGAVLSLLYARSRSLYVPFICHFANNLLAVICIKYDVRIWVLIPSVAVIVFCIFTRRKNEKKIL